MGIAATNLRGFNFLLMFLFTTLICLPGHQSDFSQRPQHSIAPQQVNLAIVGQSKRNQKTPHVACHLFELTRDTATRADHNLPLHQPTLYQLKQKPVGSFLEVSLKFSLKCTKESTCCIQQNLIYQIILGTFLIHIEVVIIIVSEPIQPDLTD